jgi:anti-sigma28 factor (negative regulator of flagellin synthesis)
MDVDTTDGRDTMAQSRMKNVNVIRESISQSEYEVNAAAVAAAIVERLLAGKLLPNERS